MSYPTDLQDLRTADILSELSRRQILASKGLCPYCNQSTKTHTCPYASNLNEFHPYRPLVVCLCGSTRFKEAFVEAMKSETLLGRIVLTVGMFERSEGLDIEGPVKAMLDRLHLEKITMADEVFVLNVGGYIGKSTANEIAFAKKIGRNVRSLEAM